MAEKASFSLIVPCYNEEDSIGAFSAELSKFCIEFKQNFPEFILNVLIVDNNSTDKSKVLLEAAQLPDGQAMQVLDCQRQGYGAALKFGFSHIQSTYYSFLDLDNTYPLLDLIPMLKKLREENLDMIYGARIHQMSDISFIRGFGNKFYVLLLKHLLHCQLSDVCSGMRIFTAQKQPEVLKLNRDDLSFSIQLTGYSVLQKWKTAEIPIDYRERIGESKLSVIKDGWLFLIVIIKQYLYGHE